MIGPIRRTLTLIVLSIRDMLVSAGPVASVTVLGGCGSSHQ